MQHVLSRDLHGEPLQAPRRHFQERQVRRPVVHRRVHVQRRGFHQPGFAFVVPPRRGDAAGAWAVRKPGNHPREVADFPARHPIRVALHLRPGGQQNSARDAAKHRQQPADHHEHHQVIADQDRATAAGAAHQNSVHRAVGHRHQAQALHYQGNPPGEDPRQQLQHHQHPAVHHGGGGQQFREAGNGDRGRERQGVGVRGGRVPDDEVGHAGMQLRGECNRERGAESGQHGGDDADARDVRDHRGGQAADGG